MTHPPSLRLDGKRVLITGGSRGLGSVLGCLLARLGARVAFTYTRDEQGARKTLASIQASGEGRAFQVSVLDQDGTEAMISALETAWGGIDILVNNAGISQNLPMPLLEEEHFDKVMDINVKGTYLTSRAVLRGMYRQHSGVILNIGSVAGMRSMDAPIHYCTSKAAVAGLTMALARQVARHGVRVNCLALGLLEDGMGRNVPEHRLADYLKHCALGRLGTLDETAQYAAFLVSDACSYMTGQVSVFDGGL